MESSFLPALMSRLSTALQELYEVALPPVEQASHMAQWVLGLLALGYIGFQLWGKWGRGESIDFYGLLRPFAIGLIVLFFGAFCSFLQVLVRPIEAVTASFSASVYEDFSAAEQAYEKAQEDLRNSMAQWEREEQEGEEPPSTAASEEEQTLQTYRHGVEAWAQLAQLSVVGIVLYFQVYVVAAQLILLLVGPFAFAFSLLPGFLSNCQHWMARYLQLLLYAPLASFIGFVVALLLSHGLFQPFTETLQEFSFAEMEGSAYEEARQIQLCMQAAVALFHTLSFVLYTRIPHFARGLIHSFQPSSSC